MERSLEEMADEIRRDLAQLREEAAEAKKARYEPREPSKWVGPNADLSELGPGARIAEPRTQERKAGGGLARALKALSLSTDASGGYLVAQELHEEILRPLRARSAVLSLGARFVPVAKELDVASLSTEATSYWVAENAAIPTSEETFAQSALVRPRALAALVPVSRRLLDAADVNESVESIVTGDLAEILSLRADLAFLWGTGTSEEPLGISNVSGLTAAPDLAPMVTCPNLMT